MIYSSFGHQNKTTFTDLMFHINGNGGMSITKHPLVLVLSSQQDKQNTLLPGCSLVGTKGFISWV